MVSAKSSDTASYTTSTPSPSPRPQWVKYEPDDVHHSPFVVFYEITRACDLVCQHCRACAQPKPHPSELSFDSACGLIGQLAEFRRPPLLVFTGGDPLKRPDVYDLVRHARQVGLTTAMTPSATPLVTDQAVHDLRKAGISRLAVSLDGIDAATHDAFRGVDGSYDHTLSIMAAARQADLPMQVNTTVTRRNVGQLDAMAQMLADEKIVLWSVFFLVPVGRGLAEQRITPAEYEQVFERLWHHAESQPYAIKTTEAPHYRRYVLQRDGDPQRGDVTGRAERAPIGINDGKGVMFISHTGQVFPSGFMPIEAGRYPRQSVVDVYQNSEIFRKLRDPDLLGGKCGACEFRHDCGGSRARAYALTRDPLAAEPDCAYLPQSWRIGS